MTTGPLIKSFAPVPFEVKAVDDNGRRIKGLAAAWSVDLGDDVIEKGAFSKTLDHWRRSKKAIPLLDGHNAFGSVSNVIGKMESATETDDGLEAEFTMLGDDPQADAAYKRAKAGMVTGLSIGYTPMDWKMEKQGDKKLRHLKEVRLHEVSMVVFPMNTDAQILQVKHDFAQLLAVLTDDQKLELRTLLEPTAIASAPPAPEEKVTYATPAQMERLRLIMGQLRFRDHAAASPSRTSGETDHGNPEYRRQA